MPARSLAFPGQNLRRPCSCSLLYSALDIHVLALEGEAPIIARRSAQQDLKWDVREEVQLGTQPARPRGLVQDGVRMDGLVQIILEAHRLLVY